MSLLYHAYVYLEFLILACTIYILAPGAGADAVDYKLISICHKGDVVVSQDYGVAAMALGKGLTRFGEPWL